MPVGRGVGASGRREALRGNPRSYKAQAVGNAVVIFEPHPRPDELRSLSDHFRLPPADSNGTSMTG